MKIGILGTGMVGRTHAAKLAELGHTVMLGTRDTAVSLANDQTDRMGNPPLRIWLEQHPGVQLGTLAQTAAFGEWVINATNGMASLAALEQAGSENLNGKVLIDIANPLDFSRGMPPSLFISNTDSLGEQIQRAFPQARVVKTLNTMTAAIMVNPAALPGGHDVFLCGDDAQAKAQVAAWLRDGYGWQSVLDLGDIRAARGLEMVLPLWLSLMGTLNTPMFNFKVVR